MSFPSGWRGYWTVTIDHTLVQAAPGCFFVRLSDAPSAFWSALSLVSDTTGATIRVSEDDGTTLVPSHVVGINTSTPAGCLAVYGLDISTSVDTVFRIWGGHATAGAPAVGDPEGRNATFAAWAGLYFPGMSTADYTGNGRTLTAVNSPTTAASGYEGITAAVYNGSNQYHTYAGSQAVSGWPLTLEALAYAENNTAYYNIGSLGNTASLNNFFLLRFSEDSPGDCIGGSLRGNSGTESAAKTSNSYSVDTWHYAAADRNANTGTTHAVLDGGTAGTQSTTVATPLAFDVLSIGVLRRSTLVQYLDGRVAMFGISSSVRSAAYYATMKEALKADTFYSAGSWTASVSVTGTVASAVSVAGAASGARGVVGTVAAAVGITGAAAGIRHLYGTASALVSLMGSALGFAGRYGTVGAHVDLAASTTDYDGAALGTALAPVSVAARAVGFVGSLGPADGRSIAPYLTGAAATGAPAREVDGSTGGYRSGVRFQSMEWDGDDPLVGVRILEVSGGNGQGIGTLTAATAGSVAWTPPGGTAGTALTLAVDAEGVAPGADTGAWVRLRRTASNPLEGAKTLRCLDVYNNLFPDVVTSDAVAGLVTARALMLLNSGGAVREFRAWLGDCDGDFEIALELPTAGELTGAGLTWSAATTEGTGPAISLVGAAGEVGLHVRRTLAADTAASPSQVWIVNYSYSDGSTTYTCAVRGRYRIEREDLEAEGIWIGDGEQPDFDGAPAETWTTRPHTTALGLTLPTTVYMARRTRNKWGLWGIPTAVERYDLDAGGAATLRAPSGPTDVSVMQTAANKPTVAATYDAVADGETIRAALWCIWLTADGTDPDGTGDPDGYARVQHNGAIDDLAWISTGDALADGTEVRALVRLRRLDDTGTGASPDVIQLTDSGAGVLKFDQAITDWDTDGYAAVRTRFGRLLEVIHYSGLVVASGQTTVTVDERGLMGTEATATNPNYIVTPVVAVDSENTDVATWTISGVASGRPWGALIYGTAGAQAQAAVEGPDGVTPQVLDAGENVHLIMGEGWSSLYVDTTLVWRCLYHGDSGAANGFYIPSEWTLVTATITGASAGTGPVDAVDSDTIYLVVRGQRRVLIDLAAMEIHAADWNGSVALEEKAEQDGVLEQFGATLFLTWDPAREDYRPSVEVTALGVVNGALAINHGLNAAAVEGLWN